MHQICGNYYTITLPTYCIPKFLVLLKCMHQTLPLLLRFSSVSFVHFRPALYPIHLKGLGTRLVVDYGVYLQFSQLQLLNFAYIIKEVAESFVE